jgi:hypothetical protein
MAWLPKHQGQLKHDLVTNSAGALRVSLLIALSVSAAVVAYVVSVNRQGFPRLDEGSYAGSLRWPEQDKEVKIYVEQSADRQGMLFLAFESNWVPQFVDLVTVKDRMAQAVYLKSPFGDLRLTGKRLGEAHEYVGVIRGEQGLAKGDWSLHGLQKAPLLYDREQLRHWLLLMAESWSVEDRLADSRNQIARRQQDISELEALIDDQEKLKSKTEDELKEARKEYLKAQEEFSQLADKAEGLAKQFHLARRVTPMGRLVALARETLERENRWISSMLRTDMGGRSGVLDDELKKGERIMSLKHAIAQEKARIFELSNDRSKESQGHRVLNAPGSLDELWGPSPAVVRQ